jgi:hypothetical protein
VLLSAVHTAASFAANLGGDYPTAASHAAEAVRLVRAGGHSEALDSAMTGVAHVALAMGDLEAMRRVATEALAGCERAGDTWGRGTPLAALGYAALFDNEPAGARSRFEGAAPLLRAMGDPRWLIIQALVPLVDATLPLGDAAAADEALGSRLDELAARGEAMAQDDLAELAGAG